MVDPRAEDLLALSRDVSRGWAALEPWREAVALDPAAHAGDEPLEAVRLIAGKSTWDALAALSPSVVDVPLRDALRTWVYAFVQARIGRADEASWARLASEARGLPEDESSKRVSWRQAWQGVVEARTVEQVAVALVAAAGAAPPLADAARTAAGRRVEVARRLGLDHPWQGVVSVASDVLLRSAARLLDRTEDLSRAVWREALGDEMGAAPVLHAAMGREAGEGWPARLSAAWLAETFGSGVRGLPLDLPRLPRALGASSFARALYVFGHAVRVSGAPRSMPFALARSPAFLAAHRLGFVFAALGADVDWQLRALGVGRRVAAGQSRILARTALLDARLHAARLLLGDDAAPVARDRFAEIGARLFGAEADPRLRGAWPVARRDEPARFVGLLESVALAAEMRDRFDSDWYRNPRAWAHLRAAAATPAHEAVDAAALPGHVESLSRALEGALG